MRSSSRKLINNMRSIPKVYHLPIIHDIDSRTALLPLPQPCNRSQRFLWLSFVAILFAIEFPRNAFNNK